MKRILLPFGASMLSSVADVALLWPVSVRHAAWQAPGPPGTTS